MPREGRGNHRRLLGAAGFVQEPEMGVRWKIQTVHEVLEARVGPNGVKSRINHQLNQTGIPLRIGFFKPVKSLILLPEGDMNLGEKKRRYVALLYMLAPCI